MPIINSANICPLTWAGLKNNMESFSKVKKQEWQTWAKTWRAFYAPWVPSQERINIYRSLIKKYVKGRDVLILGSTPRVRDLLASLRFNVMLVDISPLMVRAMTSLRKTKSPEKIVFNNWLKMNLNKKFDLIIGDSTTCNLQPKDYQNYFKNIKKHLKDDGAVILQNPSTVRTKSKITFSKIIKKVKQNPDYYKNYLNRAYDYVDLSLNSIKNNMFDFGGLDREYFNKFYQKEISKKELKLLSFGFGKLMVSFYSQSKLREILKKHFLIAEEVYEKKHKVYKDFYRIYLLKKK